MRRLAMCFGMGILLLTSAGGIAQDAASPLAFLEGRWISDSPDGWQEETWSAKHGGNVIGTFRVVKGGSGVFFEFWSVEERDGKRVMLMKHFNAGLKGWEEKDVATVLPLVKSGPFVAEFADSTVTLHYERRGDVLMAGVTHVRDGKADTEMFRMKKVTAD